MASSDVTRAERESIARLRYIVVDCLDLDPSARLRGSRFWGSLLGLPPVRRLDNYLSMGYALPGCDPVLQLVDRVTIDKSPIHFDIEGPNTKDYEKIVARAERPGGTIVEYVEEAGYTLTVMTDPYGSEFCVDRAPSGLPQSSGP